MDFLDMLLVGYIVVMCIGTLWGLYANGDIDAEIQEEDN